MHNGNTIIEIKGIYKNFGDLKVLKGVNNEIKSGEVVSIIGASGSGKSTLLRCMNLLEFPTFGEVWMEGKLLTPVDPYLHPEVITASKTFKKLVAEKYYDGIRFHRVIEGFMIQAGDPYSRDTSMINMWGQGGPDYTVPAEFVNEYWHKKGALAAARKGDMANPTKASSGSQFYIVHDENACLHLDGQYSIFGEVVEGLDVIDKIASVPVDRMDRPYEDVIIKEVRPVMVEPQVPVQTDSTAVEKKEE